MYIMLWALCILYGKDGGRGGIRVMTDEKYIKARNKQIPKAERYANEVDGRPISQAEDLAWSKTFLLKRKFLVQLNPDSILTW